MKTQAIIPAAGIGARLETDLPKPLAKLCGKPLFLHTLEIFEQCPVIDSVIVVGHKDKISDLKSVVRQYGLKKIDQIVVGGETRRESVSNGLAKLDPDTDIVVVHDGARPLISKQLIEDSVALCREEDAVAVAVPVRSTIKRVNQKNLCVEETLKREGLWEIQTPQVFKRDVLLKAHLAYKGDNPTDDAQMVEQIGVRVKIVSGSYANIKITTKEDLTVAELFLEAKG